jgi:hypothetical protein
MRHAAMVPSDEYFRTFVKHLCTTVVPQPLPDTKHVTKRRVRKRANGGKPLYKGFEISGDPLYLCLLKHYF